MLATVFTNRAGFGVPLRERLNKQLLRIEPLKSIG